MSLKVQFFGHFPLEYFGGGEAASISIANYLGDHGLEVRFTSDSQYSGLRRLTAQELKPFIRSFSYRHEPYMHYSHNSLRRLFRPLPPISLFDRNAVNLLLVDRIPPVEFLIEVARSEVPIVLLLHGLSLEDVLPPNPLATTYQLFLRAAFHVFRVLRDSPHVFFQVLNGPMKYRLQSIGIPDSRVFVIPNGVEIDQYPVPKVGSTFGLLFMGRLEVTSKGIDFLVHVLRELSTVRPADMEVRVLGSGSTPSVLDELADLEWIARPGFVSEVEKLSILRESNLMLVTSYIEPFSMVTIEGLVSGVPVLTTPSLGPSTIVGTDVSFGRVLPYSHRSFCQAILEYYTEWKQDKGEYARRSVSMSRIARREFSAASMGSAYMRLIESVNRAVLEAR